MLGKLLKRKEDQSTSELTIKAASYDQLCKDLGQDYLDIFEGVHIKRGSEATDGGTSSDSDISEDAETEGLPET